MTTAPAPTAPLEPGDPGFVGGADAVAPPESQPQEEAMVYEDYYGFEDSQQWFFPDKRQFIEFKRMNEGERAKFQKMTTRDVTVVRGSGDAKVRVDPATERHELIVASVTGWNLMRRDNTGKPVPVPFTKGSPGAELEKWLQVANPTFVDALETAIRKANPWLTSEMTIEDIEKEEDRLRELKEEIRERERGEGSSSSK